MDQQTDRYDPADLTSEQNEKILLGVLGSLLFSLAGGLLHFLIYRLGYFASISGLIAAYAAFFGYGFFSGNKLSKKGMVIAAVVSILVTTVANFASYVYDVHQLVGSDGISLSFGDLLSHSFALLRDGSLEITKGRYIYGYEMDTAAFYKDLGVSLLFCGLGIFGFIRTTLQRIRAASKKSTLQ